MSDLQRWDWDLDCGQFEPYNDGEYVLYEDHATALREQAERIKAIEAENELLTAGLQAVADLIAESDGVAGLHLNGDVATWDELRTGGRFEDWLLAFDDARLRAQAEGEG